MGSARTATLGTLGPVRAAQTACGLACPHEVARMGSLTGVRARSSASIKLDCFELRRALYQLKTYMQLAYVFIMRLRRPASQ